MKLRAAFSAYAHHLRLMTEMYSQPWDDVRLDEDELGVQLRLGRCEGRVAFRELPPRADGGPLRGAIVLWTAPARADRARESCVAQWVFDLDGRVEPSPLLPAAPARFLGEAHDALLLTRMLVQQVRPAPRLMPGVLNWMSRA